MEFLRSTISLEASLVWFYLDSKGDGTNWLLRRPDGVEALLNKWTIESQARHWCLSFGPLAATCRDVTGTFPLFELAQATGLSRILMDLITLPPPALECLFYLSLDFYTPFTLVYPHATPRIAATILTFLDLNKPLPWVLLINSYENPWKRLDSGFPEGRPWL